MYKKKSIVLHRTLFLKGVARSTLIDHFSKSRFYVGAVKKTFCHSCRNVGRANQNASRNL